MIVLTQHLHLAPEHLCGEDYLRSGCDPSRDIAGINMIGGDVVEVSPSYDTSGATAIAGAHAVTELLCIWGSNSKIRGLDPRFLKIL